MLLSFFSDESRLVKAENDIAETFCYNYKNIDINYAAAPCLCRMLL